MVNHTYLEKIELNEDDFITRGRHTLLYRHPSNPAYIVKVLAMGKVLGLVGNPSKKPEGLTHRLKNSTWIGNNRIERKINRFFLMKAHVREFTEMVRLRFQNERLPQPPSFLQQIIGFADTNLGFSMVVKAEKDREGNYAPTLATLINKNAIDKTVLLKLDFFFKQLEKYDVILSDFVSKNIVYAYDETHGDHFVLIDGMNDKGIVPVLRLSQRLRVRARQRKIKNLKQRIAIMTSPLHVDE